MGMKYLNRETNRIAFFNDENAEGFINFESIYNAMNNTSVITEELCDIVLNRVKIRLLRRNDDLGYRVFYNVGYVNNKEDWKMDPHRVWTSICSIRKNSLTLKEFIETFVGSITSLKMYRSVADGEYGHITYKKLFEEESLELVKYDETPKATKRFTTYSTWDVEEEAERATSNRPIYRYTPYGIDFNALEYVCRPRVDAWEELNSIFNSATSSADISSTTTTSGSNSHAEGTATTVTTEGNNNHHVSTAGIFEF